ncbi:MAG: hypothetical protein IM631_12785 [Cytophagales bacterium]|nr:hypothetical protein [Cytophagales bacterium]MCA6382392.1 hypothetical protein [Cytophagales bacterium]
MASDGLSNRAKQGTCRMCQRVRSTEKYLMAVGEVRHGFATGHIWECADAEDCDKAAEKKMTDKPAGSLVYERIKAAITKGRLKEYIHIN